MILNVVYLVCTHGVYAGALDVPSRTMIEVTHSDGLELMERQRVGES